MAVMPGEKFGVLGKKFVTPLRQRAEKNDVISPLAVRAVLVGSESAMIAELKVMTAQSAGTIGAHPKRIDIGEGARIDAPLQVALEPARFRLFSAEQDQIPGQFTRATAL